MSTIEFRFYVIILSVSLALKTLITFIFTIYQDETSKVLTLDTGSIKIYFSSNVLSIIVLLNTSSKIVRAKKKISLFLVDNLDMLVNNKTHCCHHICEKNFTTLNSRYRITVYNNLGFTKIAKSCFGNHIK